MSARIVLYETPEIAAGFGPLARVRPVYDLMCGARTLYDKAAAAFAPTALESAPRPGLAALDETRGRTLFARTEGGTEDVIFLSGDLVVTPEIARIALEAPAGASFQLAKSCVGAKLPAARAREIQSAGGGAVVPRLLEEAAAGSAVLIEAKRFQAPWELVEANGEEIEREWEELTAALEAPDWRQVDSRAALIEPGRIRLEAGARVEALAVLDASEGPILLCEGATVDPLARVIGPAVIGRGSRVLGGRVGSGTTIGPVCRVNGEVEHSILLGYSNKAHDGFLGHSILGEWVNLGALTSNSDLKNNYGAVRVTFDGREVETGLTKAGVFLGDHVKTGIGSLLPTGGVVDVGCNLFGGGSFAPRWVPAFTWWDGQEMREHRFDGFVTTARRAMARRDIVWNAAIEAVFAKLFEATAGARREAGVAASVLSRDGAEARV